MRSAEALQLKAYLKNKLTKENTTTSEAMSKNLPGAGFRITPP